jgi:cytochrome c-type biogenesis protein
MALDISFPGAFLAGLLSFLSPCVLPLVPPYLCFLAGTTLDELTEASGDDPALPRRVVITSLLFVAGFSTVFIILGASASALRPYLVQRFELFGLTFGMAEIAGLVIILFGLHFLDILRIPFLHRHAGYRHDALPPGILGAYLIGLAFGFGWTPCIGPVLATIIAVASSQESIGAGMALLGVYSAGLGVPFILAAFAVRPFIGFVTRFRRHLRQVERVMGGLLVLTGVFFVFGWFERGAYFLLETFPGLATLG